MRLTAFSCLLLMACSGPSAVDAGEAPRDAAAADAGSARDAGAVSDAGEMRDAGLSPDAGHRPDAGRRSDAGHSPPDAGLLGPGECSTSCTPTCFRPITCVKQCGGPAASCGCCECEAPSFDPITCGSEG